MPTDALRDRFVTETLPMAVLRDPSPFYEAFEEGDDALTQYVTALWEALCESVGTTLSEHPFFPSFEPLILDDTADGFLAVWYLELSATPTASAVCAAIVFGAAMDPRVFSGTPTALPKGETLLPREWRAPNGVPSATALEPLYQGCNNELLLFDAPSPRRVQRDTPLPAAERATAFLDAVVRWCLSHE